MKKILSLAISYCFFMHNGFAQGAAENELKNFRFGLKAVPSLNWYKPDDKKKFESLGAKVGFGWGLHMEFRLSSLTVLATGIQIDYDRGNLGFKDTASYFFNTKDQVFLEPKDTTGKKWVLYKLNDRFYKCNYITIPLYLKMKTKEIGYMTYFGNFGLNTGFRLKSKVNDNVTQLNSLNNPKSDLTDIANTDDMNLLRLQLYIGGGAEYNLSGSTSLVFGLGYNYGFSNILNKQSKYLLRNDKSAVKQNAFANNIALTLGILF